jgi:hypothetical protein
MTARMSIAPQKKMQSVADGGVCGKGTFQMETWCKAGGAGALARDVPVVIGETADLSMT